MYRELLLGAGHRRDKIIIPKDTPETFQNLTTVDYNLECKPDFCFDLNNRRDWINCFKENEFNEIHAYEVFEHIGSQGDLDSFFNLFEQCWFTLIKDGFLCATVPSRFSPWLWGDPGHTRAILPETLIFLDQTSYAQCGHTAMSDYRNIWHGDFKIIESRDDRMNHFFILQAVKPARV
jgi:hypothetical protein